MHRSKLRNQFLKFQTHEPRLRYNKQRYLCVSLLRKSKKKYYIDLKMSVINDNRKFWENVKPFFGNKNKRNKTITLEEGNDVINDDGKLAQNFNDYFVNIALSLSITSFQENDDNVNNYNIDNIITKFEGHLSIVATKEQMKKFNKTFTFQYVSTDKVDSIIKKVNSKKVSKSDDISTKVIKEFKTFFAEFLSKNFNSSLETGYFPEDFTCAEVAPIYKKNHKKVKSNYRPISLLSNISKVYERCMQEQLDKYFSDLLSKYQCGFRQDYGTQNYLLSMIEKLRKKRYKKGIFAAVLTDLSKACIPHNLLIAKLSAYGFDRKSLMFILAYLKSRKQRTRIGSAFSD